MLAKRILVVEDQQDAANMLVAGLASLGPALSTVCVSSAEEALRALETQHFDLLIADVLLPGISGLELMARFRRRNPATRVILLSGVRDLEIRKQVARSGADAFFFKPVEIADVLDAVERQLGLVKSSLPSELAVIGGAEDLDTTAQVLAELRFNLQAHSAMLISSDGRVLARAGVLPDSGIEHGLVSQLLILSQAAGRVAALVNNGHPDDLITVRGKDYFIHMTSVGSVYALALITKPVNSARFAALSEALQKTVLSLSNGLSQPQQEPEEERLADTDPHLERLLDLEDTKPSRRTAERYAERYWETAELPPLPLPGAISYAQAARIGLAPAEES